MKTTSRTICLAVACCLVAGAAVVLLLPTGTVDLSAGCIDYAHDTQGNTLVVTGIVKVTGPSGSKTNITIRLPYYDKKGVLKGQPGLSKDMGSANILYFEKTWAVVLASTTNTSPSNTFFYSVKCGSALTLLGSIETNSLQFAFAGRNGIVMFNEVAQNYQLYDKALARVGMPQTVPTNPVPLNAGTYFYCALDNLVQVWRVKKGFFQTVNATGQFFSINESKKLCCITNGAIHSFYSYK